MSTALILVLAMLLDAALGEPRWLWSRLPHPAVVMGGAVKFFDQTFNMGTARRLNGVATMAALGLGALALGALLQTLGGLVEIIIVAILLAQKSLVGHVRAVGDGLRVSLGDGRRAVAMIVGRDTSTMQDSDVARGAIESAAENLSDGVIAPAFWFLVAGLPGLLLYKITNTADSTIGYRTPRHEAFGWAAARFDDLLNVIPARLTALLIALGYGLMSQWRDIAAEARLHRSPNAGWPEAAMARALNIALSGPRSYDGEMRDFPFVNKAGRRDIGAEEIDAACAVLWRSWALALGVILIAAVVLD
ncbi:adenosylcobinamide-phosphate synthase CbiB [Roseovarius sp. 2305UL8-3]|uniref:adenosylcobinamide-phosphate synthase CbiB n=1 Tax=Roseovarius conchicola TaxID=3121636 RepID=UPI00352821D3